MAFFQRDLIKTQDTEFHKLGPSDLCRNPASDHTRDTFVRQLFFQTHIGHCRVDQLQEQMHFVRFGVGTIGNMPAQWLSGGGFAALWELPW